MTRIGRIRTRIRTGCPANPADDGDQNGIKREADGTQMTRIGRIRTRIRTGCPADDGDQNNHPGLRPPLERGIRTGTKNKSLVLSLFLSDSVVNCSL
jgi:hypothetical protein